MTTEEFIANFIKLAGWFIAAGLGVWLKLSPKGRERIIGPSPLEVRAAEELITRREFSEHKGQVHSRLSDLRNEVDKRFDDLNRERAESLKNLHQHIGSGTSAVMEAIKDLRHEFNDRLKEGNSRMNDHDRSIAALEAVKSNKGGRA